MWVDDLISKCAELSNEAYSRADVDIGGTQLIVGDWDDYKIVAFRGTEFDGTDILTDLKIRTKNGAHRGFTEAYYKVQDAMHDMVGVDHRGIIFTGHSLGGALAQIASDRLFAGPISTVTFGSPRVYLRDQPTLQPSHYRIVNGWDIVPRLPIYPYRHPTEPTNIKVGSWWRPLKAHKMENYLT